MRFQSDKLESYKNVLPLVFFGTLLLTRAHVPSYLVFDEVHYIPAAKSLILLQDNHNWMHPPLAKFILGLGWLIFTKALHLIGEPTVFRWVAIAFGLWALASVRAWMQALGFRSSTARLATWITGFNFLWFVQSKTAMLDIFELAFASWGLLHIWRTESLDRLKNAEAALIPLLNRNFIMGWVFLGLALACKWVAIPMVLLGTVFLFWFMPGEKLRLERFKRCAAGLTILGLAYFLTFVPLAFLEKNAVPIADFFAYHQYMLNGFRSIAHASHPYASAWWQWPTLLRPVWYLYEATPAGEKGIWAGGNPILFWTALPFTFFLLWKMLSQSISWPFLRRPERRPVRDEDLAPHVLTLLYWLPLSFWALAPRSLQVFYYYLPSSLWLGPIIAWAYERFGIYYFRRSRGWLLFGFMLLCGLVFLYFLPIMDARPLPPGRFQSYMWLRSWI